MTLRQFQMTWSCRLRDARNDDNMRDLDINGRYV